MSVFKRNASCAHAAIDCGDLAPVKNGVTSGDSIVVGSVKTYSCDECYELHGPQTLTCQEDGYWNGSVPTCNRKFCQFEIVTFLVTLLIL